MEQSYSSFELAKKYVLTNFKELIEIEQLIQMSRVLGITDEEILQIKIDFTDEIYNSLKNLVINKLCLEFELDSNDVTISNYEITLFRSTRFKLTNPLMYDALINKIKSLSYSLCLM